MVGCELMNIFNEVGYPVFVSGILFWFIKTYLDKLVNSFIEISKNLIKVSSSLEKLHNKDL